MPHFPTPAPTSPRHPRRRGFTLVEMLTVMVIIIILMSITVGVTIGIQRQRQVMRAKGELTGIAQGLEQFKAAYGKYPPVDGTGGASGEQNMLRAITGRARWTLVGAASSGGKPELRFESVPMTQDPPAWGKAYIQSGLLTLGPDPNGGSSEPVALDPWGNAYLYRYKKTADIASNSSSSSWKSINFVVVSRGPDGLPSAAEQNFIWQSGGGGRQEGVLSNDYFESQPEMADNLTYPIME